MGKRKNEMIFDKLDIPILKEMFKMQNLSLNK